MRNRTKQMGDIAQNPSRPALRSLSHEADLGRAFGAAAGGERDRARAFGALLRLRVLGGAARHQVVDRRDHEEEHSSRCEHGLDSRARATQSTSGGIPPDSSVSPPGSGPVKAHLEGVPHVGAGAEPAPRSRHDDRAYTVVLIGRADRIRLSDAICGVQALRRSGPLRVMIAICS